MQGRPVWLASIAFRDRFGDVIPTTSWTDEMLAWADDAIDRSLSDLGDESREVSFRMMVTLCRHRGLSDAEEAALPIDFNQFQATDTAGTAVELLWARGVSGDAHRPCEQPGKIFAFASRTDIWLPEPCGQCGPCKAREEAS